MLVTVLGCSGSVPGPDSPASGYLVREGAGAVVLDLGNGTLGALQRHLDPFDLDAVVLSHLHPDHCADLTALTVYRRYHPSPAHHRPIPLYAPAPAAERLAAAYATSAEERSRTDLGDVYDFRTYGGDPVGIGPFDVRAGRVDHVCEAYAVRVTAAGRSLVYSGDTGPCDALVDLARDADVLLAEASWPHRPDNPRGVHLSGHDAGATAEAAGVRRLLLTHVPPWTDAATVLAEARDAFAGPVELVEAGGHYEI